MSHPNRGIVLLVVVVVVAMLSLAGLSFVAMMHTEHKSIYLQGEELQLEHVVGSGQEFLKAFLDRPHSLQEEAGGTWDTPDLFRDAVVFEDRQTGRGGRFSIVSPGGEGSSSVRYGLENESAKLSLAALPLWERREQGAGRRALLGLPGMTEEAADSILDWLDGDNIARPSGAEAEHYAELGVPYRPRNAVPQCLEELLLVRGVTRELLLGPEEGRSGGPGAERQSPVGFQSRGGQSVPWASLLTVAGAERNRSFDGQPRVFLNQNDLSQLYRQIEEIEPSWAKFLIAWRQYGPYQGAGSVEELATLPFNPSLPPRFPMLSPLDLVGAKIRIPSPDGRTGKVYASPLTGDALSLRQNLFKLLDRTTVEDVPVLAGRVNLNLAPREVLRAVPGMDEALAEQILAARGARREDPDRRHPAWPLAEGLAALPKMKALLPFLTAGGDIYRAEIVGSVDGVRRSVRAAVIVDAAQSPPRQVYWKRGAGP